MSLKLNALLLALISAPIAWTPALAETSPVYSALHLKKGIMYQGELCMTLDEGIYGPPMGGRLLRVGVISFGSNHHLAASDGYWGKGYGTLEQLEGKTRINLTSRLMTDVVYSYGWPSTADTWWSGISIEVDNTTGEGVFTLDMIDIRGGISSAGSPHRSGSGLVSGFGPCPD